ncbi:hypothetical protein EVAR_73023_1 [Eumeta japonica]|uniref:Uncharacterized protein n=1 Tax=Eumeta variegata TaxID=151549 RepID=A0A4C1T6V3_EUMVA|nr:hypothetical protein EVAR_73023_1 [Eumeta japonica]
MPFVAPKTTTTTTSNNAAGRTTFRPPWVKEDGQPGLKPTPKTTVPWAKKNAEAKETEIPNPSILKKTTNATTNSVKSKLEPSAALKKTPELLKEIH